MLSWGPTVKVVVKTVWVLSRRSPGLKFRFVENETFLSEGKDRAVSFSLSGPTSTGGLAQAQGKHLKMSL